MLVFNLQLQQTYRARALYKMYCRSDRHSKYLIKIILNKHQNHYNTNNATVLKRVYNIYYNTKLNTNEMFNEFTMSRPIISLIFIMKRRLLLFRWRCNFSVLCLPPNQSAYLWLLIILLVETKIKSTFVTAKVLIC